MTEHEATSPTEAALVARVRELEARLVGEEKLAAMLASEREKLATVTAERDKLRRAYEALKTELELMKRRIYVAKAERIDVTQLELEFAATKARLDEMAKQLGEEPAPAEDGAASPPPSSLKKKKRGPRSKGRRNLFEAEMPEKRIEILDPALEGKAVRLRFEESCRLGYQRGGPVRIVVARAMYKVETPEAEPQIVTATKPKELFERGLLAPSLLAHVLVSKYRYGLPFHRLAQMLDAQGVPLDDGTMCRYAEDAGATVGCIVDAMAKDAKETAFCLSTDATGVCIQPTPLGNGKRQACRKGHFFVVLADQDHVFFEFQPAHTSKAVCEMFKGFRGYIQADAHCIYDALFRGEALTKGDKPPDEVGCWSHSRRRFWEAAVAAKSPPAREALLRIRTLFKLEEEWADLPPQQRHRHRQRVTRPMLDDFFAWAKVEFARVRDIRGVVNAAFGYAVRQEQPLRRFLDDGRLRMTNNHSERAVRPIAVGRRNWLFFGSDDHATAAANLFSLMASCQLHALVPETYLAEILRVLPHWPRDRYLELAPKYWSRTRARLDADELAREVGHLTVPPPPPAEQQPITS